MGLQAPDSILFVCTGNICRSPTAEAVMRHHLSLRYPDRRLILDSAGIHGYHVGEAPDKRTQQVARGMGVALGDLRARAVMPEDYHRFSLILAMDEGHLRHLHRQAPSGARAELALYLPYAGIERPREMPDPYYGTEAGFQQVFSLCEQASLTLLDHWFSHQTVDATFPLYKRLVKNY